MSAAKKGNSKAAAAAATTYVVRDLVLGKIRGYQPWPGMIVDPEKVPQSVLSEQPASKKTTHYCVKFFPKGDHAWLQAKDLSRLQPHEIDAFVAEPPKGKAGNKELVEGYKIAADSREWEAKMAEAEAAAAAELEDADVDELNEPGSDDAAKPKKRKRGDGARTAKKPVLERSAAESGSAPPKKKAPRKSNGKKSKDTVESEDEAADGEGEADDAGPSQQPNSPPPAKKAKQSKEDDQLANDKEAQKVKNWRHTLQKTFLPNPKKAEIKPEDMPASDAMFKEIESYEGMTVQYLAYSKIGKVMRHIALLKDGAIPDEATHDFRKRAKALVDKWHTTLDGAGAKAEAEDKDKPEANGEPAANGDAAAKAEAKEEAKEAAADGDAKMEDAAPAKEEAAAEADVPMAEA